MTPKDLIFISYSHRDKDILDELIEMLSPQIDRGLELWSDEKIQPGQEWKQKILQALEQAKVAVLLVSSHFLDSQFIKNEELSRIFDRAKCNKTLILWIPVNHCDYGSTFIGELKCVCDSPKPLRDLSSRQRNKEICAIAKKIKEAWEDPTLLAQLPLAETSTAPSSRFLSLADLYSSETSATVDRKFRRAVEQCYGGEGLRQRFPQLASAAELNWDTLKNTFTSFYKPSPELLDAFERELRDSSATELVAEAHDLVTHHLALVLKPTKNASPAKIYYTCKTYHYHSPSKGYQPIQLDGMDQRADLVVYDKPDPQKDEIEVTAILKRFLAWAKANTSLPILEIFVPVELLNQNWADQIIRKEGNETTKLLAAIPFLLRPVERLEKDCYDQALSNKIQCLSRGQGTWIVDAKALDHTYLSGSIVEQDEVVGVKRFKPLPSDETERLRWLRALRESMVPIAIWWRHGSIARPASKAACKKHLENYASLGGHKLGDPVPVGALRYAELARQRKKLLDDPLASQLVLMLDHHERTPKITAQQRAASRAMSPSYE